MCSETLRSWFYETIESENNVSNEIQAYFCRDRSNFVENVFEDTKVFLIRNGLIQNRNGKCGCHVYARLRPEAEDRWRDTTKTRIMRENFSVWNKVAELLDRTNRERGRTDEQADMLTTLHITRSIYRLNCNWKLTFRASLIPRNNISRFDGAKNTDSI